MNFEPEKIKYRIHINKTTNRKIRQKTILLICIDCGKNNWVLYDKKKMTQDNYQYSCRRCANMFFIPSNFPWHIFDINKDSHGHILILLACQECGYKRWISLSTAKKEKYKNLCIPCGNRQLGELKRKKERWQYFYKTIKIYPDNPYYSMTRKNGQIREHRLIMAQHLGRPLNNNEIVHHLDGNIHNNSLDNLELRIVGEHCKGHEADIYQQKFTNLYHKIKILETDTIELKNKVNILTYLLLFQFNKKNNYE